MCFAYADPPYPGKAFYYPERLECDHADLIRRLTSGFPDGWALSTSAEALPGVLALCPAGVRVLAWFRRPRGGVAWEPVILSGGRRASRRDGLRDALIYKGRYNAFPGAMVGMKPPQFSEWVFRHLGARAGDSLDDLFPGSGAVSLAWARYAGNPSRGSATSTRDASLSPGESSSDALIRRAGPARRVARGRLELGATA